MVIRVFYQLNEIFDLPRHGGVLTLWTLENMGVYDG
jgi:hypothetical protein